VNIHRRPLGLAINCFLYKRPQLSGKIKKPEGKKVVEHILNNFKPKELEILKKTSKKITLALESIINEGLSKAMSLHN